MTDQRPKILIVEDDESLSEVLRERFDNEDFDVLVAKDGEKGLTLALDKQPDVILLDIVMPKVDGLTMLKNLRAQEKGRTSRVIVMTNLSDSKEVHAALANGAHDFLVKSDWTIADIVESVRHQLNEPHSFT